MLIMRKINSYSFCKWLEFKQTPCPPITNAFYMAEFFHMKIIPYKISSKDCTMLIICQLTIVIAFHNSLEFEKQQQPDSNSINQLSSVY